MSQDRTLESVLILVFIFGYVSNTAVSAFIKWVADRLDYR